jgi:hypothetical protein
MARVVRSALEWPCLIDSRFDGPGVNGLGTLELGYGARMVYHGAKLICAARTPALALQPKDKNPAGHVACIIQNRRGVVLNWRM